MLNIHTNSSSHLLFLYLPRSQRISEKRRGMILKKLDYSQTDLDLLFSKRNLKYSLARDLSTGKIKQQYIQ